VQDDESDSESPLIPEDLIYDEEDRLKLDAMNDFQKQKVLYERGEKRRKQLQRRQAKRAARSTGSSKKATQRAALHEMRAKREKLSHRTRRTGEEEEGELREMRRPEEMIKEDSPSPREEQEREVGVAPSRVTVSLNEMQDAILKREKLVSWLGKPYIVFSLFPQFVLILLVGIGKT